MPAKLSPDDIRSEVSRFWSALTAKSVELLEEFYAHESSVFGTTATRQEPGRLAATRREREYFNPLTTLRAQTGYIDVILLGDNAAIATYTFTMSATKVASSSMKGGEESIRNGRATQVFARDPDGNLRIVHEHLSVPIGG